MILTDEDLSNNGTSVKMLKKFKKIVFVVAKSFNLDYFKPVYKLTVYGFEYNNGEEIIVPIKSITYTKKSDYKRVYKKFKDLLN